MRGSDNDGCAVKTAQPSKFLGVFGMLALDTLTEREQQVLALVAQGLSNSEIAARLVISEKTVRNHITHILAKLGLRTRPQLIAAARDNGWVARP